MSRFWKERVIAKLKINEELDVEPRNLAELARMLRGGRGADKGGIYVTFDLEREPQQMSSAYVDEICELLDIGPPFVETDDDEELQRDLGVIRSLQPEARRELMVIARRMPRR